jgi:biopolymer transport protein ExbD
MKFQRQAKIFRGQLDVAPFACVFFLMLFFLMMRSFLYTPGVIVPIRPPQAEAFSGTENPTVIMAVTAAGQYIMDNRVVAETDLKAILQNKLATLPKSGRGLTLVVIPDKAVSYEVLTKVRASARDAGIGEVLEGVTPSPYAPRAEK